MAKIKAGEIVSDLILKAVTFDMLENPTRDLWGPDYPFLPVVNKDTGGIGRVWATGSRTTIFYIDSRKKIPRTLKGLAGKQKFSYETRADVIRAGWRLHPDFVCPNGFFPKR